MKTTSPLSDTVVGAVKSKVIWVNAAAALLPILEYAQGQIMAIRDLLPPDMYMYAYIAIIAANIFLRFFTTEALKNK